MKRKEVIKIGNEEFTIENKKVNYQDLESQTKYKTIDECYTKPSTTKQVVYNHYKNLLDNGCDMVLRYGIVSYNFNFINLGAIILLNNEMYYAHITRCYNRLYKVIEES